MILHWFRRDLRLSDHIALAAAGDEPILPVFVLDPALLRSPRAGAPRIAFTLAALRELDGELRGRGSRLIVRTGRPEQVLRSLLAESGARRITFAADYSPYARRRDARVAAELSGEAYDDQILHAPGQVLKRDGTPYSVFTPFKRTWLALPKPGLAKCTPTFANTDIRSEPIPALEDLGLQLPAGFVLPEASESAARRLLAGFVAGALADYATHRNLLQAGSTSGLAPYLRFGLLSPRQAYAAAREARAGFRSAEQASVDAWVSQLVWREFYQHILYFYPQVATDDFRSEYREIPWRDAPGDLEAWKSGETGYPVVDAAMRQLAQTGWMPNRARMIVASFLTKHLLVDWRAGERYFMQALIDGDLAANNGGWQWCAGTGTQPYFRIFNPVVQGRKFDPDGAYVRRWVPELSNLPTEHIHTPWKLQSPPRGYPAPLVDHKLARGRALAAFGNAKAPYRAQSAKKLHLELK